MATFTFDVSGGALLAGTAPFDAIIAHIFTMAGGVTLAGAATVDVTIAHVFTMEGGVRVAGAATVSVTSHVFEVVGGLRLAGAATVLVLFDQTYTMTGGLVVAGEAAVSVSTAHIFSMAGGLKLAGAATVGTGTALHISIVGGMRLAGAATIATITRAFQADMIGGLRVGGSASIQFVQDVYMTGHVILGGSGYPTGAVRDFLQRCDIGTTDALENAADAAAHYVAQVRSRPMVLGNLMTMHGVMVGRILAAPTTDGHILVRLVRDGGAETQGIVVSLNPVALERAVTSLIDDLRLSESYTTQIEFIDNTNEETDWALYQLGVKYREEQ